GARLRHQCAETYHFDIRAGRRTGRAGRSSGGAHSASIGLDGDQPRVGGVCRRSDRRHGVDHGLYRHRLWAWPGRGPDQGLLPARVQHGDLPCHGSGTVGETGWPVRADTMMTNGQRSVLIAVVAVLALVAPWVAYPVFLMTALCFALFACAFNLLLG